MAVVGALGGATYLPRTERVKLIVVLARTRLVAFLTAEARADAVFVLFVERFVAITLSMTPLSSGP